MILRDKFDDSTLIEFEHLCDKPIEEFLGYLLERKKDYKLSWEDIKELCNSYYNKDYSESYYRKTLQYKIPSTLYSKEEESEEDIFNNSLLAKIEKEKVKLHDERVQVNALIRKISREETFKEIALEAVEKMSSKKELEPLYLKDTYLEDKDNEGILLLSDWHFGMDFSNPWNSFNEEVAISRINKLKEEVINKCLFNKVRTIHVLNLGDMIAGRIHLTIRLESRYDVITQIMRVSELLSEFLYELSKFFEIEYYSCLDNHSRLEPNKAESMDTESLARITDWYIKNRLPNINVNTNKFGDDIITFNIKGFKVAGVHGHYDKPLNCAKEIPALTRENYDLICMAHRHHFSCDEENGTLIVANSSLMGTDSYAKNLRLSAAPSQNLIITSKNNVMEVLYRITL
jgi:hypothetical protein